MIEIYHDIVTNEETDELLKYYSDNINREYPITDNVYSFKAVDVMDYNQKKISSKLILNNPLFVRVQLINHTIPHIESMHRHTSKWTSIIFLNDDYMGGDLIIENVIIKPKKNTLLVFPGNLNHKVTRVTEGDRYTMVSFLKNDKPIVKQQII